MWLIVHNLFSPYVIFGFHKIRRKNIRKENKLKNIFYILFYERGTVAPSFLFYNY